MNNVVPIVRTPASRATDNSASRKAERVINETGKRDSDMRRVLMGFYAHQGTTTKEMSELTGIDRHLAGRRAPDLLTAGLLERIDGDDGYRWSVKSKGLALIHRLNGRNDQKDI